MHIQSLFRTSVLAAGCTTGKILEFHGIVAKVIYCKQLVNFRTNKFLIPAKALLIPKLHTVAPQRLDQLR